ncbi:F-box protein At4g18380-like isoform X2 [Benincasa hispida]|uniref:F-box protein At4g18380-like isoform X2 n=1 Tax=Benincasa hispida TaxID=102211 RepID=UPI001902B89B|nr:F-box protein At4g18380-like isoform X2 [Benincasa hispida]
MDQTNNQIPIPIQNHHQEQHVDQDLFDLLPDAILHLIFTKLTDAPSLIRCLTVSKRFASLTSQSDSVFLAIPRLLLDSKSKSRITRTSQSSSTIRFFVRRFLFTPFRLIRRLIARTSQSSSGFSEWYYWPSVALKELKGIKFVHMELPCCGDEIGSNHNGGALLKWKAEFGSELKSCVVLGASSLRRKSIVESDLEVKETEENRLDLDSESEMGDEELKLRIIWTISSLIAASMRHYLVKQMVNDFPLLKTVLITDSTKQGRLCMEEKEVMELRESMKSSLSSSIGASSVQRTVIPDLKMEMWHVPVLDLPAAGFVMTAATLVVIRPSGGGIGLDGLDSIGDEFDDEEREKLGVYGEAVRKLMKLKRNYALEREKKDREKIGERNRREEPYW